MKRDTLDTIRAVVAVMLVGAFIATVGAARLWPLVALALVGLGAVAWHLSARGDALARLLRSALDEVRLLRLQRERLLADGADAMALLDAIGEHYPGTVQAARLIAERQYEATTDTDAPVGFRVLR